MEDELGSFFAEIDQIEATVAEDGPQEQETSTIGSKRPRTDELPAVPATVSYSKPAEIKNHTVYTYDYSALENPEPEPYYAASYDYSHAVASESAGLAAYSTNTQSSAPVQLRTNKPCVRKAADEVWVDESLKEWPDNDFRVFVGDIGKDITTEQLAKAFAHYKSFAKAKVIRGNTDDKPKGYGFVSFLDPMDCAKAIREMNGKYLGPRPMKVTKSTWNERDIKEANKKDKKKRKMYQSLGL